MIFRRKNISFTKKLAPQREKKKLSSRLQSTICLLQQMQLSKTGAASDFAIYILDVKQIWGKKFRGNNEIVDRSCMSCLAVCSKLHFRRRLLVIVVQSVTFQHNVAKIRRFFGVLVLIKVSACHGTQFRSKEFSFLI